MNLSNYRVYYTIQKEEYKIEKEYKMERTYRGVQKGLLRVKIGHTDTLLIPCVPL